MKSTRLLIARAFACLLVVFALTLSGCLTVNLPAGNTEDCPSCQGAGEIECLGCGGTGRTTAFGDTSGHTDACSSCRGTGHFNCNFCGGDGKF